MSPTYYFEPVTAHRSRSGKCPVCGKRLTRSHTFEQTVNPYNQNPDGTIKTRQEVWLAVNEQADAWVPDFRHQACKEDQ